MALHIISYLISKTIPSNYYVPVTIVILALVIIRSLAQGRRTNRDRDLHARTILITGAFTPLGLKILEHLAKKGAHIIVLLPTSCLTSQQDDILSLLRSTTSNESIYAEPCPLDSPSYIKKFCENFVNTSEDKSRRIDALILAHEYQRIGTWKWGLNEPKSLTEAEICLRDQYSMASFLLITLLLPAMLVAPIDRDIRIIALINPFYAAAVQQFNPGLLSSSFYNIEADKETKNAEQHPTGVLEGQRALRTAVFIRHLQRILDVLPGPGSNINSTSSASEENEKQASIKRDDSTKSNIMAMSVSPGISRGDIVQPFLFPSECMASFLRRWFSTILYFFALPLLFVLTKGTTEAMQSVLHVLCVPSLLSRQRVPAGEDVAQVPKPLSPDIAQQTAQMGRSRDDEEVLIPGALYADCSTVKLQLMHALSSKEAKSSPVSGKNLGLGDEPLGRKVWETFEEGVKLWEKIEKERENRGRK